MRARCMLNYNVQFMRTIRRNASSAQVYGLICRQPIHGVANRMDPPNLTLNLVIYYNVARHVRKTSSEAVSGSCSLWKRSLKYHPEWMRRETHCLDHIWHVVNKKNISYNSWIRIYLLIIWLSWNENLLFISRTPWIVHYIIICWCNLIKKKKNIFVIRRLFNVYYQFHILI